MKNPKSPKPGTARLKHRKQVLADFIYGIDALILMAEREDMGMAARILFTAKEELVHWAVTMRFHESAEERFINRQLYSPRLSALDGKSDESDSPARRKRDKSA
jgi:hypothetical protein